MHFLWFCWGHEYKRRSWKLYALRIFNKVHLSLFQAICIKTYPIIFCWLSPLWLFELTTWRAAYSGIQQVIIYSFEKRSFSHVYRILILSLRNNRKANKCFWCVVLGNDRTKGNISVKFKQLLRWDPQRPTIVYSDGVSSFLKERIY